MRINNKNKNTNGYEYISLQDVTKFCNYSQEYLSLRARQGKLKALKLGRNWVTKKEWLKEYIGQVEDYNNYVTERRAEKLVKHAPPTNLPIEALSRVKGLGLRDLRSAFAAAMAIALIMAGGVFGKEALLQTYRDISPYVEEVGKAGDFMIADAAQSVLETLQDIESFSDDFYLAAINYQDTSRFLSDVFKEYGQWIKNQILEIKIEDII